MSTRKTDLDIARVRKANALNLKLADAGIYGIEVSAGGRSGPYRVTVSRLNEREMRALVNHLASLKAPDATA